MIRNVFNNPVNDQVIVDALVENEKVKIQRVAAQRQKLAADALGPSGENHVLVLLKGQLSRKDSTKLKAGDCVVATADGKNVIDVVSSDEESVWLSISFDGTVGKGLFPSPDEIALKRLKDSVKLNVFAGRIDSLAESKDVRVERLSSLGRSASAGECETSFNQFVLVMSGQMDLDLQHEAGGAEKADRHAARVFEGQKISLSPGDYYCIPANTRTRIDSTKADETTVTLSVYFGGNLQ